MMGRPAVLPVPLYELVGPHGPGGMKMEQNTLTPANMKRGGRYNWKGQPDRLIYLGRNWSGNGYWHQFEKIGDPRPVWCEVVDADLHMLEKTLTFNAELTGAASRRPG